LWIRRTPRSVTGKGGLKRGEPTQLIEFEGPYRRRGGLTVWGQSKHELQD